MTRTLQLGMLALVALAACSDSPAPAPATATPARPAARGPAAASTAPDAAAAAAPAEPYTYQYNPVAKRDPFRSPDPERNQAQNELCNEPLCQFDLDQLTLVGVVTGMANPFAMVEDPAGRGYIVRRNTKIGRQGGKVSRILRDSVTVNETWNAPDGKQIVNPVTLQLKADRAKEPDTDLGTGTQY